MKLFKTACSCARQPSPVSAGADVPMQTVLKVGKTGDWTAIGSGSDPVLVSLLFFLQWGNPFLRMSWGFKCVHDLFSMTVEKVDIIMITMMILTHSWLSRGRVVSTSLQAAKLRLGEIIDEDHDLIWLRPWKLLSMIMLILEILLLILYDGWLCYGNLWWSG